MLSLRVRVAGLLDVGIEEDTTFRELILLSLLDPNNWSSVTCTVYCSPVGDCLYSCARFDEEMEMFRRLMKSSDVEHVHLWSLIGH